MKAGMVEMKMEMKAGMVENSFVAVKPVETPTAKNIEEAVSAAMDELHKPGWLEKLVALGAGGAAMMQGKLLRLK